MTSPMIEFGATFDLNKIKSEDACLYLAKMLRALANDLDYRRAQILDTRSNARPMDDKYPIIKAANRALAVHKAGGNGEAECRKLAADFMVPGEHVHALYRRKVRSFEAQSRARRDGLIKKWDYQGLSHSQIVQRLSKAGFQLSRARVCNILNKTA